MKLGAGFVINAVMLVISIVVTPIVVDQIAAVNTTGWDFTGAAGAITLMNLIPFIWIAILVTTLIYTGLKGAGVIKKVTIVYKVRGLKLKIKRIALFPRTSQVPE